MSFTKADLLNEINTLVERYIEQELAAMIPPDQNDGQDVEVIVESDSEGHDVDLVTGDIWDLENQTIIGQKDLKTGKKTLFAGEEEEEETPLDEEEKNEEPEPEPPLKIKT